MQIAIRRLSHRLYRDTSFVHRWRSERVRDMVRLLNLPSQARIVDLGGTEFMWRLFEHDYQVTLVNLPGFNPPVTDPSRFSRIEGDACNLKDVFADNSFDAVFSNSTIEHVGDEPRQAAYAAEVRRLAPAYWVQTPSPRFPIEIHTGVPFYWKLPASMRARLLDHWEQKLEVWTAMIRETRVLSRKRMIDLFPDGQIYLESRLGFEKSFSFYRPYPENDAQPSPVAPPLVSATP